MPRETFGESWLQIEDILERGDAQELRDYLTQLDPGEIARALSRMEEEDQHKLVTLLTPEDAANLLEELSDTQAANLLEELPVDAAASIVDEMESDERVDVLAELDEEDAEAILAQMDPEEALDARQLLTYDPNTAGGIMVTEYLAYKQVLTIGDVLDDLRANAEQYADFRVQYVYVIDKKKKLIGVIRLRDLVLSPGSTPLTDIMITNLVYVRIDTPLEELEQLFDRHAFIGVPVLDMHDRLVGIVQRDDVEEAHGDRAEQNFMRFSGIVAGEEFRTMPIGSRALRRLAFLMPNIGLNLISASVVALFTQTISAVIALAVFLPIISDMSGCSGNQAVAVSIRELSLGLIKPRDFILVMWKEIQIGVLNGIMLGLLLGTIAGIYVYWKGQFADPMAILYFACVIGAALTLNTLVAATIGGLIPLGLRAIKVDPALASSPILTTVTDMIGFFLVLGMATVALTHLTA